MQKLLENIQRIIGILEKHQVEYIIVGGVGSILQGAEITTKDIDVCPNNTSENLSRLSNALKELGARLRGAEDVEVPITPELLQNMQIGTWLTHHGDLDIIQYIPAGKSGSHYRYKKLYENHRDAIVIDIKVHVASLRMTKLYSDYCSLAFSASAAV